jgi:tetratricopeptide (TPR) repeat protein/glycosyltransferase involved in cell wall biosynthesis
VSSRSCDRHPVAVAHISEIRQQDLLALGREEQERELSSFEARLHQWADRMASIAERGGTMVSVEIPVFKGGWVMPAIESVLYQSSTSWGLTVRWDGGDDLSRRILETVQRLDHPKIRVHFGENRGIAYNRRFLTEHSVGDYILPVDDDDMLAPDSIEKFLAFAQAKPWSGIVRARREFIDEVGQPVVADPWFPFEPRHYQHGMVQDVSNHCQPMLISRSAYARTAGWEGFEEFRSAGEDCDIFIKVEEVAPIELLDDVLYYYRLSDRRTSLVITDRAAYEMWRRLADQAIARIGLPLKRANDRPPFSYDKLPRARPTVDMVEAVVFGAAGAASSLSERTVASLKSCGIDDEAIHVVATAAAGDEAIRASTRSLVCYVRAGVELEAGGLGALLDAMHQRDADLVGPRIVSTDGSLACGAPAFSDTLVPVPVGMGVPHRDRYDQVTNASWLPSMLLVVRREVINAVGGFEAVRSDLVADADFSLKARRRDFSCVYAGSVAATDDGSGVTPSASVPDLEWLSAKWKPYANLYEPLDFGAEMTDYKALYDHGNALLRDGKADAAVAVFRGVVGLKPDFSWGFHSLGDALFQAERWQDAVDAYGQAIELKPDVPWSHLHLGNALSKLERWSDATAAYGRATQIDPRIAAIHSQLGNALLRQARWEEARAAFDEAIRLEAGDFWACYGRADALAALDRWEESVESYQRAITLRSDVSWAYHHLGDSLVKLDRFAEAVVAYRRAIEIEPGVASSHRKLGDALFRIGDFEAAVSAFQQAVVLEPNAATSYGSLGNALSEMARLEEAVAAYRQAIALDPEVAWYRTNLGHTLVRLERYEDSVPIYQSVIELQPDAPEAHINLGHVLFELDQFREALAAFERAIELDPHEFWAHYGRGDALSSPSLERWSEAIESYERANAIRSDEFFSHFNLGEALTRLERWERAAAAFRRATEIDPSSGRAYWKLGGVLSELGDFEAAVSALQQAVVLEPNTATSYGSLGNALFEMGRLEEAVAAYRQAIALDPEVAWYRTNLGHTLVRQERYEDSVPVYQSVIELQPDAPEAHVNLGNVLSKLQRWTEAIVSYERAVELDPRPFWAHHYLGYALLQVSRWADAAAVLTTAIAIDSGFCWSHHYLGNALAKVDRWDEAADAFRRALALEPDMVWAANSLGEMLAKLQQWDEAREAFERTLALQPDFSSAIHNLADALLHLGRVDEAARWYQRSDDAFPVWCRANIHPAVRPLEQWIERLSEGARPAAGDCETRLLFVFDTDYGELTTAMYLLLGQPMVEKATLLLPPRLFVNNRDVLPGRTYLYRTAEDILEAVERHRPDVVVIASGYLFSIHHICSPEMLQELIARLTARGCQVVTTDPFLGLLSHLGTTTHVSIDIPAHASPHEVHLKQENDVMLIEHFSKLVPILRDLDHLYPVYPAGPGDVPSRDGIRSIASFNDALIVDQAVASGAFPDGPPAPAMTEGGKPLWVFVLASRDYELQAAYYGKVEFAGLMLAKLEEALRCGRHPVLIAPYSCVRSIVAFVEARGEPPASDVTLMTFCSFKRFSALLLAAEYVFYWNALSHSMFMRLFNGLPTFLFDRGHLVRNVTPLYERIVQWYYQGWEPVYLDPRQPLTLEGLTGPAEAYRAGARQIRGSLRRAPAPAEMVQRIRHQGTDVSVR